MTARWEGEEEVLLFDLERERGIVTNEAGLIVFWLCDGEHRWKDIMRELRARYVVEAGVAKEIRQFVAQLLACKMVLPE